MLQTLWMKEFSYCTSQLELICVTSEPQSLNEQKNIIKSNRRAKNCQLSPIRGNFFSSSHPKMLSYLYGSLPIVHEIPDIYSIFFFYHFQIVQALHMAFLRGQCFSISICSQELSIWFFFLILKVSRNLYHNFYRHKKYSNISYSLGTVLSRSLMN